MRLILQKGLISGDLPHLNLLKVLTFDLVFVNDGFNINNQYVAAEAFMCCWCRLTIGG